MNRVGVTGSRFAMTKHRQIIRAAIEDAMPIDVLVHGGGKGVDRLARQIAEEMGIPTEEYPADWDKHGRAAGPLRNQAMVDATAVLWLAFPICGGRNAGTWDCVRRAADAGIHVWLTPLEPLTVDEERKMGIRPGALASE